MIAVQNRSYHLLKAKRSFAPGSILPEKVLKEPALNIYQMSADALRLQKSKRSTHSKGVWGKEGNGG